MTKTVTSIKSKRIFTNILMYGVVLGALIAASRAQAASYGVRVVDEHGTPLGNAAVCIGTQGVADQFGRFLTSEDGLVTLDQVPAVPLYIVVSKDKYQGVTFQEPIRNWNLIKEVTLLLDGVGPTCENASKPVKAVDGPITIKNLYATKKGASYTIDSEIEGKPSHYRVSVRKDFKNAKWQPYAKQISFSGDAKGKLYYQVKRFSGTKNGWLESRSPVVNISVN